MSINPASHPFGTDASVPTYLLENSAKKKRWKPTKEHTTTLTQFYLEHKGKMTPEDVHSLASSLGTTDDRIRTWFVNHRTQLKPLLDPSLSSRQNPTQSAEISPGETSSFSLSASDLPHDPSFFQAQKMSIQFGAHQPPLFSSPCPNVSSPEISVPHPQYGGIFSSVDRAELNRSDIPESSEARAPVVSLSPLSSAVNFHTGGDDSFLANDSDNFFSCY